MHQHIQTLLSNGVSVQNILYVNFFDDRLHKMTKDSLGQILEAYFLLFPEKKNTQKIYCFFDEIQLIQGWEFFIERLQRTEMCEIFITGSSAQMLSREIGTQMRGRALAWELFPFSFREYLRSQNIACPAELSMKQRLVVQNAFEKYWECGGFPEVVNSSKNVRTRIHQEYFNSIIFRDLVERHDISHPRAISDLAHWMADNTASLYSINSLTGYLKSLGHKVPKSSVSDYITWFEDAYAFFSVRLFDASLSRSQANPKKIYAIDHSMVRSVSSGILTNAGHLLENLVFTALRRVSSDIFYYRTKQGREVDFIAIDTSNKKSLIQVCETFVDEKTKKREIVALQEAMTELGMKVGIVVTRHEAETLSADQLKIHVIPIWRFLLELPDAPCDNAFAKLQGALHD